MGSYHAQLSSYPADLGAGAHTQSYPTHGGYHSKNQQRHYFSATQGLGSVEFSSLRSQLAALESQLAERDKDAAEARTVIGYLLKLNAYSATERSTHFSHRLGQKEPDPPDVLLAGEVKESLAVIIDLLRDKLNTTIDDKKYPPVAYRCSEDACGDLLDLSDDCPALQPPVIEKKSLALKRPPTHSATLLEPRPGIREVQDATKITNPFSGQVPKPESDTFPLFPYVTRFDQPRTQGRCPTNLEHADHAGGNLPNSSSVSSSFGLAGSAQFEASESTSFTSLNSSFNSSDDETDMWAAFPQDGHKPGNVKGGLNHTWCEISSAGVPASPSDVDTPDPAQARTSLFAPKWSADLSAVLASEREDAIFIHKRCAGATDYLFPDYFRYGIRFCPDPTETDIYRTILVDNLPAGVTISALLQKIRGGAIQSVKSLDTTSITGGLSALITFVHEKGARAVLDYQAQRRGAVPPLEFDSVRARVTLLPTPTYPMCKKLQTAMTKHAHTRCLAVTNFPRTAVAPADLERDLRVYPAMTTHRIVERKMRADGVLELGFASVDYAGWAYALLTRGHR
ncbi:MAG: hypothetical protein Q9193_006256, partial [Seirophora villosa]